MLAVIELGLGRCATTFIWFSSRLHKFATYFSNENSFAAGKVNYVLDFCYTFVTPALYVYLGFMLFSTVYNYYHGGQLTFSP